MKFITVMPIYKSIEWTKKTIPIYKKYFDEPLLVINNNSDSEESKCAKEHGCIILENKGNKNHGDALDIALRWCKKKKIEGMIAIEPDCLITGRRWYDALIKAIHHGHWMAGLNKESHGPIRPCPSVWLVDEVKYSFNTVSKGNDTYHKKFHEVFNIQLLINNLNRSQKSNKSIIFWLFLWDTGLKNWFDMAVKNKVKHIKLENPDLIHMWHGSQRNPRDSITIV